MEKAEIFVITKQYIRLSYAILFRLVQSLTKIRKIPEYFIGVLEISYILSVKFAKSSFKLYLLIMVQIHTGPIVHHIQNRSFAFQGS